MLGKKNDFHYQMELSASGSRSRLLLYEVKKVLLLEDGKASFQISGGEISVLGAGLKVGWFFEKTVEVRGRISEVRMREKEV